MIRREERPTRFSIGEAGDFFRSQDYLSHRTEFAEYLQQLCQVVKIRTIEQGYAGLLATLRWIINTFGASCPVTEEEVMQWTEEVWVEQIRRQHVEKGNARHCILRYLQGVLQLTSEMTQTQVKKFVRISKTTKLVDNKFALCLFADPKLPLVTQNNVELETVREHLMAQGGAIDKQGGASKPGQGLFVRDFVDDDEEDVLVEPTNKEQCTHKKCLLIPLSLLTDKTVMDFADRTGQQENYSLFGADAATPSVMSEFGGNSLDQIAPLNSTSNPNATSLHLNLTESIIQQRSRFDEQEIAEEDLERGEDTMEEESGEESGSGGESETESGGSRQQDNSVGSSTFAGDGSRQQQQQGILNDGSKTLAGSSRQQNTFDAAEVSVSTLNTRRRNMKAKTPKTQSIGEQEYFFCPVCKKPHTTSSALTRHILVGKCQPAASFNQGIIIKCSLCPKICQSNGGLVRHTKSAHADKESSISKTLPLRPKARAAAEERASKLVVSPVGTRIRRGQSTLAKVFMHLCFLLLLSFHGDFGLEICTIILVFKLFLFSSAIVFGLKICTI